jgi:hypothetical protein
VRVRLTDIRDHSVRETELTPESRDMAGWQSGVIGWSIGQKGSGSPVQLDAPLGECRVGIFTFSLGLLLWGVAKQLPEVWLLIPQGRPSGKLVPFEPERWLLIEREEMSRVAMGGDVRLRLDQSPVRFGNYIFEILAVPSVARECCAFCSELLGTYFRVGSQPACPACTEKFRKERRANLAGNYRRALAAGIVAALAGGAIHGLVLATARISAGSVLIGIAVGMSMRIASRESSGNRHRLTAVALTFVAGSLPLWRGAGTIMAAIYLAVGMLAAWLVAGRNVRTEIHGPFHSKAG